MNGAVIVTGASAGIGAEAAILLGAQKRKLVLTARRSEALNEVAGKIRKAGGEATCVVGDICEKDTRDKVVQAALEAGGVEALVNNAGYGQPGPLELIDEKYSRRQFDVNVFALMEMTRAVLPHMRKARKGRIVNVASIVGRVTVPMMGW